MGIPDSDIVKAIFQMLPGFISAWLFYGLTAHARPTPFERRSSINLHDVLRGDCHTVEQMSFSGRPVVVVWSLDC